MHCSDSTEGLEWTSVELLLDNYCCKDKNFDILSRRDDAFRPAAKGTRYHKIVQRFYFGSYFVFILYLKKGIDVKSFGVNLY
jgi:hypothetical protein